AQVVGEAERRAPLRENVPIARALRGAERALETLAQVGRETIVVQQRVVHVQQEYRAVLQHGVDFSICGSCQVSPPSMSLSAAAGPQLPGSYSATGRPPLKTGST